MDDGSIIQIIVMFVMVVFSAYFSATETAYTSCNRVTLKTMENAGNKKAKKVLDLLDNYDKLLTTILVGNNIVNITLSTVCTVFFIENVSKNLGATLATIVSTVAVLIFGEITPKSVAKENSESFSMAVSGSISFLMIVLSPLGYFFSFFKLLANKLFKSKGTEISTDDELLVLVDEAQEIGEFDSEESELIRSAIEFGEQEVIDIFTPRVDIVAVEFGASNSEIAKVFSESGFSRLPVYKESVDNIIGTINAKDFYKKVYHRSTPVDEIICEPFFIPASMKARDLLRELKSRKRHMAIIADEYGGTKGIVTLEDVLEELVGEIFDEHEAPTLDLVEIDENKFLVEGSLDFDEFAEKFQVEFETEMNTLGGFVMERLGKIPEVNDSFEFENLAIKVIETDEKRASKLEITIKDTKKEISES